jgi:L-asparaginase
VVLYMKAGMSVEEAVRETANDMGALKDGLISRVTIHAIDTRENYKVVAVNGDGTQRHWLWKSGMDAPVALPAEPIVMSGAVAKPSPAERYTAA